MVKLKLVRYIIYYRGYGSKLSQKSSFTKSDNIIILKLV